MQGKFELAWWGILLGVVGLIAAAAATGTTTAGPVIVNISRDADPYYTRSHARMPARPLDGMPARVD